MDDFLSAIRELARQQAELERRSVEEPRMLPGEDVESAYADDVEHWRTVYSELVGFKENVLAEVGRSRELASDDAQPELARDERVMELELMRLKVHLNYWERRSSNIGDRSSGDGRER
jgi:hypothetical protein